MANESNETNEKLAREILHRLDRISEKMDGMLTTSEEIKGMTKEILATFHAQSEKLDDILRDTGAIIECNETRRPSH